MFVDGRIVHRLVMLILKVDELYVKLMNHLPSHEFVVSGGLVVREFRGLIYVYNYEMTRDLDLVCGNLDHHLNTSGTCQCTVSIGYSSCHQQPPH